MSHQELSLSLQDIIAMAIKIKPAHPIGHAVGQDTLVIQGKSGGKPIRTKKPK
jgi:hypothetical protein